MEVVIDQKCNETHIRDFVTTPQKANKSELTDRQIKLRNKNKEKFTELNLIRKIKP